MVTCDCPVGAASAGQTLASLCGGGQFMLFMGLLEVFIRSQCDLEDPCNRPKAMLSRELDYEYDFIVIGGGSGGSVTVCNLHLFTASAQGAMCFILHYSVSLHRHRDYLKYRNGKFCSLKRVSELHNWTLAQSWLRKKACWTWWISVNKHEKLSLNFQLRKKQWNWNVLISFIIDWICYQRFKEDSFAIELDYVGAIKKFSFARFSKNSQFMFRRARNQLCSYRDVISHPIP